MEINIHIIIKFRSTSLGLAVEQTLPTLCGRTDALHYFYDPSISLISSDSPQNYTANAVVTGVMRVGPGLYTALGDMIHRRGTIVLCTRLMEEMSYIFTVFFVHISILLAVYYRIVMSLHGNIICFVRHPRRRFFVPEFIWFRLGRRHVN